VRSRLKRQKSSTKFFIPKFNKITFASQLSLRRDYAAIGRALLGGGPKPLKIAEKVALHKQLPLDMGKPADYPAKRT